MPWTTELVRVNKNVRIDGNHVDRPCTSRREASRTCDQDIVRASSVSSPDTAKASVGTHSFFLRCRASSRRNASSTRLRMGIPSLAARDFTSRARSSGSSIVVFMSSRYPVPVNMGVRFLLWPHAEGPPIGSGPSPCWLLASWLLLSSGSAPACMGRPRRDRGIRPAACSVP